MAEALVSVILDQLASIVDEEVKLVVDVDEEALNLISNFHSIKIVLEEAESRQVKEKSVGEWLDKLKDASYDMDDVLDEWNTSVRKFEVKESKPIRKVCSLIPCYRFCFGQVVLRHDISLKIKDLNRKLDVIAMEKDRFSFSSKAIVEPKRLEIKSVIDVLEVHGRDHDKDKLINMLIESSEEPTIPIISIVGMGGIGKTTLAHLVFNNDKVSAHFDKKIWVCVSKPFDEIRIALVILESLEGNVSKLIELEMILQHISQSLERKKFFLVLDDVWTENPNDWKHLKNSWKFGSQESRILITTRKENVANAIGTTKKILLEALSERECWSLFSQLALFERTRKESKKWEDVGRKIISKCKGLPLAIKVLGNLLSFKSNVEEWQTILDNEIWELEEVEKEIFSPLLLSYYDLPSTLRKCFSYCAIFSKDYEIKKDKLIKLWMAQSYLWDECTKDMELIGEECFESLAMCSFFQDFKRDEFDGSIISCKVHDIMHDFAQFVTKNEYFSIEIDDVEESQVNFFFEKGRHLKVGLKSGGSLPTYIYNAKKLRSLVVKCKNVSNMTLSKLLDNFIRLRTLELSGFKDNYWDNMYIEEVPREIKNLIHLRYLNLSKIRY